jgi:hypothetical protein
MTSQQDMKTSELIETLNAQAKEIADKGLCGWGNTMLASAELLQHRQQEIDRLRGLLQTAACPSCNGDGAFYDGHGQVCQCQFCDERQQALAAPKVGEKL